MALNKVRLLDEDQLLGLLNQVSTYTRNVYLVITIRMQLKICTSSNFSKVKTITAMPAYLKTNLFIKWMSNLSPKKCIFCSFVTPYVALKLKTRKQLFILYHFSWESYTHCEFIKFSFTLLAFVWRPHVYIF